jgi:hypothetical protein
MKLIDKLLRRESRPSATKRRNYATDTEELPPPSLAGEPTRSPANSEGRVHNAEAAPSTFVVPVTINSKRDRAPSFRLHHLGLLPTPHVEVKINLVRPFETILSGNATGRGDLAFFSGGWPAGHPIPKEAEVTKAWIAGPRVRRATKGRAPTPGVGNQGERSETSEPARMGGPSGAPSFEPTS